MGKVTKESLTERIKRLESRGNAEYALGLTMNEEYQLEAYRMLLDLMPDGEHEHEHEWINVRHHDCDLMEQVCECGAKRSVYIRRPVRY